LLELDRLPGDVPILLEHLHTQEQYAEARNYLFQVGRDQGIAFYGAKH
jgi:hypothetical protein